MIIDNRIGKIKISGPIEHLHDIIKSNLFSKLIILKTEKIDGWVNDIYEYTACSELFDVVENGCGIPFYNVKFTTHEDGIIIYIVQKANR